MTKAIGVDLRCLAVQKYNDGEDAEEVASELRICSDSVRKWARLLKTYGTLEPRKRANKPRKANYEQLKYIIAENPSITQAEIAQIVGMSKSGVGDALKRIGIVYKKKRYHIRKQTH